MWWHWGGKNDTVNNVDELISVYLSLCTPKVVVMVALVLILMMMMMMMHNWVLSICICLFILMCSIEYVGAG